MIFFSRFNSEQKKLIFLASLGGALEFYDFIILKTLSSIKKVNFSLTDGQSSNINGFVAAETR